MITTDTGAKKIENSDNWRQIFDAHNDSVDAEDKIVPEMAPIVNGNKSTVGAAIGEYVLVRNSSITGITDGAYTAAKAVPANTTIDSTYLTAVGTGGALNALNSNTKDSINASCSFSGTPNNDGWIVTDARLDSRIPVAVLNPTRSGWKYFFTKNNNISQTYWCVGVLGATSSDGTFAGDVVSISRSFYGI